MNCTPQVHAHAGRTGEPEPPITRVFKSQFFGGGPVTAAVRQQKIWLT